ncbi:LysR family transcriptional regulator [Clostridium sp. MCC353]|uniref:LysR family transcriptional regulator n=1 Tax=Clostridium sp. MCC353 TaxID=2592646 RepID=UPI001C03853D|nr:LysR family transcriptional regulator [Clostridium sp. MCC353]MBT9779045.1 LysR family transcriptional regulator [Clostridium sp. MCC353]
MEEKDYALLLDLYETKNITKTAGRLYSTQPALTKRIQKIEEELGCRLFYRSKKGILFTPAGEELLPYARQITAAAAAMRDQINLTKGTVGGTLNLGSSLNYSHYRLPFILKAYSSLYPAVHITISTGQSKQLYQMLQNEFISIAIARGEFAWNEGKVLVSREPMCIVYSKKFEGMNLKEIPYIGRQNDDNLIEQIDRWRLEHGLSEIPVKLWVDNVNSARNMVVQGLGWCILPQICLDDFDGYVEKLYFKDGTPLERSTYILYKNNYFELPQVRLFIQQLLKYESDHVYC